MKYLVAAALIVGFAAAGAARAETIWAPPAEIADKVKEAAGAGAAAAPAAEAKPAAAAEARKPATPAEKQKDCKAQADAKGLHGKKRKQFTADCLKG